MACETSGATRGFEHGDYVCATIAELLWPDLDLRQWPRMVARIPPHVCMDAKTVFDCLGGDNMPGDRRVAIDVACLRESLLEANDSGVRWLPGPQQPGDELTKHLSNGVMSKLGADGCWTLIESDEVRELREGQQARRREYRLAAKARETARRDAAPIAGPADDLAQNV